LIGNSKSGGWALSFAEKYPKRVYKLVLIDSSGISNHDVLEWELFKVPVLGKVVSKFINPASVQLSLKKVFYHQEKVNREMVSEITTPLTFPQKQKSTVPSRKVFRMGGRFSCCRFGF
jgi:hypothetical protein